MSKAKEAFEHSIKDAEELLAHFDAINTKPPPENAEVLKRAGLVMALTAWETYVEDRLREGVQARLQVLHGSPVGKFVERRLDEELRKFHNPNAEKTKRVFLEYLDVDVTARWAWTNYDSAKAKKTLDDLLQKRGDAVHRSKVRAAGSPSPHLVKRSDLEQYIKFLRDLVKTTDEALGTTVS